jgi:enoyl-CoA hydratase/3-hydroxyacyl-CoA dehydrogenase
LQPLKITDEEIVEMIFFPVVNEAARVLQEGIFVQASDLDISTVLGMGFPPYRYSYLPVSCDGYPGS